MKRCLENIYNNFWFFPLAFKFVSNQAHFRYVPALDAASSLRSLSFFVISSHHKERATCWSIAFLIYRSASQSSWKKVNSAGCSGVVVWRCVLWWSYVCCSLAGCCSLPRTLWFVWLFFEHRNKNTVHPDRLRRLLLICQSLYDLSQRHTTAASTNTLQRHTCILVKKQFKLCIWKEIIPTPQINKLINPRHKGIRIILERGNS